MDPNSGDISLNDLGQGRLTETIMEEVSQRLQTKLSFFLGEWVLDTTLGFPYYRDVLIKNPDLGVIKSLYQELITDDEGVESLVALDLALDSQTRTLSVTFQAVLVSSEVLGPITFKSLV
jgi:hypothetical protein